MMSERERLVRMLKDNETTMRSDYVAVKTQPTAKTEGKVERPGCHRIRPPPLKDTHSMTDWKEPKVPFNLFWKADRDINSSNPHVPQKPYQKIIDNEREHVQHSRPRLVITPAIPLDDLQDPGRQELLDDLYLSAAHYAMQQPYKIAGAALNVKAPLPTTYAPPQPITLPQLRPPYVSPEWRMESAAADSKELRTCVDATKEFWLLREEKNAMNGKSMDPSTSLQLK